MTILSDYGPIVAVAALGFFMYILAVRGIRNVTKQEIRAQPINQILKELGLKGSMIDLNKLTDEGFTRLRQLLLDLNTYKNQGIGIGGTGNTRLSQTLALIQGLTAVKQQAQPTQQASSDQGVQAQ